jgi:hypothetical protein
MREWAMAVRSLVAALCLAALPTLALAQPAPPAPTISAITPNFEIRYAGVVVDGGDLVVIGPPQAGQPQAAYDVAVCNSGGPAANAGMFSVVKLTPSFSSGPPSSPWSSPIFVTFNTCTVVQNVGGIRLSPAAFDPKPWTASVDIRERH